MPYLRKTFTTALSLEEIIYSLKQIPILIVLAEDLLNRTCSICLTEEEYLERSLYLLELCNTELKTVTKQIEDVYNQLQE